MIEALAALSAQDPSATDERVGGRAFGAAGEYFDDAINSLCSSFAVLLSGRAVELGTMFLSIAF